MFASQCICYESSRWAELKYIVIQGNYSSSNYSSFLIWKCTAFVLAKKLGQTKFRPTIPGQLNVSVPKYSARNGISAHKRIHQAFSNRSGA